MGVCLSAKKIEEKEKKNSDDDSESDSDIVAEGIDALLSGVPLVKRKARKKLLISKPPSVLTLHLKRFEQQQWRLSKVGKRVPFPLQLDLAPFLTEECKEKFQKICTRVKKVAISAESVKDGVKWR